MLNGKKFLLTMVDDVTDAVVASAGPVFADAHPAGRQIDVVLDDEEIRRGRVVVLDDRCDGIAGEVHIGLGLYQHHALPGENPLRHQAGELALRLPGRANLRSDRIDRLKTNRVRSIGVLGPGIP